MENENDDLFSRVIYEDHEKAFQVRLTVSEFRGVLYLSLRKYFQSFEGDFLPTKEGCTIPLTINSSLKLFLALSEILADAEVELVHEELQVVINSYKEGISDVESVSGESS